MGGKDVVFVKQQHSSSVQPADVQKKLKDIADKRFLEENGHFEFNSGQIYQDGKVFFFINQLSNNLVAFSLKIYDGHLGPICFALE